jgi:hypothetical protein
MTESWLLLIYTVPAVPSRKRAAVWRALKQAGAVYLRDGVCALPQRAETAATMRAIAAKIEGFEGQATLVEWANLAAARAAAIVERARRERAAEYADLAREAEGFLEHIERETAHRAFTFREVEELAGDLEKLRRWAGQVCARDYFDVEEARRVEDLLARCDEALGGFLEGASHSDEGHP